MSWDAISAGVAVVGLMLAIFYTLWRDWDYISWRLWRKNRVSRPRSQPQSGAYYYYHRRGPGDDLRRHLLMSAGFFGLLGMLAGYFGPPPPTAPPNMPWALALIILGLAMALLGGLYTILLVAFFGLGAGLFSRGQYRHTMGASAKGAVMAALLGAVSCGGLMQVAPPSAQSGAPWAIGGLTGAVLGAAFGAAVGAIGWVAGR